MICIKRASSAAPYYLDEFQHGDDRCGAFLDCTVI